MKWIQYAYKFDVKAKRSQEIGRNIVKVMHRFHLNNIHRRFLSFEEPNIWAFANWEFYKSWRNKKKRRQIHWNNIISCTEYATEKNIMKFIF